MITNFNGKMFTLKNISEWLIVFVAYILLSGNTILLINSMDIVPQVNVRELIWLFVGQTFNFTFFAMGFTFWCVSFFYLLVEKYNVFYSLDIGYGMNSENHITKYFFVEILDFSNPFLRSSKTKGLRE